MRKCDLTNDSLEALVRSLQSIARASVLGPKMRAAQFAAALAIEELIDRRRSDPAHILSSVPSRGQV
jgi:hypothetical protein